ncbi:leucyl aminopeptidase [Jatrophihabitans telluris]|uniref:Probable cytosol aminopeptidase n=1 Tax=Jatrophihabitans telluris TaxID=2038343 RepID=A0ABY4QUE4_9ACTN|nr:leucyl aminopeptidase [Jatrophihabitans telluris]UQX87273.1 leucyl aminopeptidase [Jatrophihabitans telluris]
MPTVSIVSPDAVLAADAVIVATVSTPEGIALVKGAEPVDKALGGRLLEALQALDASGREDEVLKIATLGQASFGLVVASGTGKGDPSRVESEQIRRAVGAALRGLNSARRVAVAISAGPSEAATIEAVSDGALLGAYRFTRFKSAATPAALRRVDVVGSTGADSRKALQRSKIISAAVNNTRDLVNTPANHLNPPSFAQYAKDNGEAAGLTVEVLDERGLRRGKFGGILAVGAGSATPPRLVRLSYSPARATTHVALVGKGITFDTGGLDLKTAMMAQMKSDMGGAAAVIEAIIAAAKLKLPIAITATVPMAENAVSGTAYRPSDILTMRDGRTVEVDNTDAEGRLILADAILRACEDSPDYLIETSTLTGGQLVALGLNTTGAMGSDAFRDRVVAAGNAAGESLWPMPLPAYLRAGLDSPVADITNLPKERWASMLVAGVFLQDFVSSGVEWVHLDIAGPSFANAPSGYTPKGGTGAIVRTLVAALSDLAG